MPDQAKLADILRSEGIQRTDLYCHDCGKNFIAQIDYDLDGNHVIECPSCGHLHYRVVKAGVVTGDRHDSDARTHKVERRNVWKSTTQPIQTSSAAHFIRDRWLNRAGG